MEANHERWHCSYLVIRHYLCLNSTEAISISPVENIFCDLQEPQKWVKWIPIYQVS